MMKLFLWKLFRTTSPDRKATHRKKNAMLRNVAFFLFIFIPLWLSSTTYHIKQDGTGNFTTIQEGIDASTHTDTILVYPGTYYENINFNGKNITIASLEMTTGNPQYIYQTIIDGQRISSCININSNETDTCIRGITITNGQGENDYPNYGGGITILGEPDALTQCDIVNCQIVRNYGSIAAGVLILDGDAYLSGTSIRENYSVNRGGGVCIFDHSQIVFDSQNRCSIYNNLACTGLDLLVETIHFDYLFVVVDTFTVSSPDRHFAQYYSNENFNFSFDILNHTLELVDCDLYVSPDGDDLNSGLSPFEPMKTINLAVRKIISNEQNPRTVYLDPGTYSLSGNQQIFAIGCKSFVNIIGEDCETTKIDGENNNYPLLHIGPGYTNSAIKNITFTNIDYELSPIMLSYSDSIKFENIVVQNAVIDRGAGIIALSSGGNVCLENVIVDNITVDNMGCSGAQFNGATSLKVMNSTFSNNISLGHTGLSAGLYTLCSGDITIENCMFIENSTTSTTFQGYASALLCADSNNMIGDTFINNCLFYNNTVNNGRSTIFAQSIDNTTVHFSNNSVINNQSPYGIEFEGNIIFSNNILQNEGDYEIALFDKTSQGIISEIDIAYSNIEAGENAIFNENNANIINWNEGNIDEDPQFLLAGDDPYQLTEFSPCIDAGTPDTTGLFLPPWDLLQHQRVWDGDNNGVTTIDMGCYEFGADSVGVVYYQLPIPDAPMTNYPNPFNPSTTIAFNLVESGEVKLEIYNIKGQKVKTLMDCYTSPGNYDCVWNGKNETGEAVSSGQYVVKLKQNEKETATKIMLLK